MSVSVQTWVYQHSEARLADRLVLLAIADEADDDGANAFPSLRRIAHKARVSKGTAHAAIGRLEEAGMLQVTRPKKTGRGKFNTYVVVMKGQDSDLSGDEEGSERVRKGQEGSAQGGTDPLTHRPTDPEDLEPDGSPSSTSKASRVEVSTDAWQLAMKARDRGDLVVHRVDRTAKDIQKLIDTGAPVGDLSKAIDMLPASMVVTTGTLGVSLSKYRLARTKQREQEEREDSVRSYYDRLSDISHTP